MQHGIDVVIPSYLGSQRILDVLESLKNQTAHPSSFGAIIVVNGPDDGTAKTVTEFARKNKQFEIVLAHSSPANVARARNVGLALCRRGYVTFLDDDDFLSPKFIETALDQIRNDRVLLMCIKDYQPGGQTKVDSILESRFNAMKGKLLFLRDEPWVLGFNAAKIIPRTLIRRKRYDESLSSGEDVVFFCNLLRSPNLKVQFSNESSAFYGRTLQRNSVSRKAASFDFSVKQRFECIKSIREIGVPYASLRARDVLINSQLTFVSEYLRENPQDVSKAQILADELRISGIDWALIPRSRAKKLVISYCFAPFNDPAAVVMSKRINAKHINVDVVSADMSSVRVKDPSLAEIAQPWILRHHQVRSAASFSDWNAISEFAILASRKSLKWHKTSRYDQLESRALWSGSHVAAALVKISEPSIKWTAEFSDPLQVGADGQLRYGPLHANKVSKRLVKAIEGEFPEISQVKNHFQLTEIVTLILANEIVLTNENQLEVMLQSYSSQLRELFVDKVKIEPQPTLGRSWYRANEKTTGSKILTSGRPIKMAYFGNFYGNRALNLLADRVNAFNTEGDRFCIDVYSGAPKVPESNGKSSIRWFEPLPYVDFLRRACEYDLLIVNDATTRGLFSKNPFLPSKLADYRGSKVPIFGIVEKGSPLSKEKLEYKALNEKSSIDRALLAILDSWDSNLSPM